MGDVANLDIVVRVINASGGGAAKVKAEISGIEAATKKANATELAGMRARMSAMGRWQSSLRLMGSSMTTYLTIPMAAAAAASGVYAFKYSEAMQKVAGINRQSATDMRLYEGSLGRVAKITGKGPTELANALYFVTSSGFAGKRALDILTQSAKGAAVGMGDTQTVADNLTTIISAYGEKNITAARAMDILTAAIRTGKAEPAEFAQSIGGVVANAAHMKVEFQEVAAAIADMTLKGIKTPEAVTALNNFLLGLTKGTKAGADYLKSVGSSYADLRDILANKGVIPAMREILRLTKGNDEVLKKIIPNIRSTKAVWGLLAGDGKQLARVFGEVADSTGEMDEAFGKWSNSATGKFRRAWASLLIEVKDFGVKMIPVATKIVGWIGKIADGFSNLPGWAKNAALGFALVTAAAGPLTSIIHEGSCDRFPGRMRHALAKVPAREHVHGVTRDAADLPSALTGWSPSISGACCGRSFPAAASVA